MTTALDPLESIVSEALDGLIIADWYQVGQGATAGLDQVQRHPRRFGDGRAGGRRAAERELHPRARAGHRDRAGEILW